MNFHQPQVALSDPLLSAIQAHPGIDFGFDYEPFPELNMEASYGARLSSLMSFAAASPWLSLQFFGRKGRTPAVNWLSAEGQLQVEKTGPEAYIMRGRRWVLPSYQRENQYAALVFFEDSPALLRFRAQRELSSPTWEEDELALAQAELVRGRAAVQLATRLHLGVQLDACALLLAHVKSTLSSLVDQQAQAGPQGARNRRQWRAFSLADLRVELDAAFLSAQHAAWALDQGSLALAPTHAALLLALDAASHASTSAHDLSLHVEPALGRQVGENHLQLMQHLGPYGVGQEALEELAQATLDASLQIG